MTRQGLQKLPATISRIEKYLNNSSVKNKDSKLSIKSYISDFEAAMNDDFNTPQGIAALFNFIKDINSEMDKFQNNCDTKILYESLNAIQSTAGTVLGIIERQISGQYEEELLNNIIDIILEIRTKMRQDKNFEMADFIRDQLIKKGVQIKDTASGVDWEIMN